VITGYVYDAGVTSRRRVDRDVQLRLTVNGIRRDREYVIGLDDEQLSEMDGQFNLLNRNIFEWQLAGKLSGIELVLQLKE
jgi:hypothetical protein